MFNNLFDAYTVRKIAPRLLLAVIGVNLSIYLCVAVVDITNIIGGGIADLLRQPFKESGAFDEASLPNNAFNIGAAITGTGIVGAVGAGAAAAFVGSGAALGALVVSQIPTILLFLLVAFVSIALIVLAIAATLVIRYGAILILTLISPVAIALLVLPGTEKYFKQWWDIFMKTLVMYPIIAVIFAISDVLAALLLVTLDQQNQAIAFVAIFVVIIALYAPLFMIPFAYKMAGGIIGGIYDFANKQGTSRFRNKVGEMKKDPHSIFGRQKNKARLGRESANLTGKQIGMGAQAARRSYRNNRGEGLGRRDSLRTAVGAYSSEGARIATAGALATALEAEEKDGDLKGALGSDDFGKAGRAYVNGDRAAASKALIDSNGKQYDFNDPNLTPEQKDQKKAAHDNMLNLIETSISRHGAAATEVFATLQDHSAGTGSNGTVMADDIIRLSHGDANMEIALTKAYRERSEKANRKEKSGLGFSKQIEITQDRKEGATEEATQSAIVTSSAERLNAGQVATMHPEGIKAMRTGLINRVKQAKSDALARGVQEEDLEQDELFGEAAAQGANIYGVLQHGSPDQLKALEYETDAKGNYTVRKGFMDNPDLQVNGKSFLATVESMRGSMDKNGEPTNMGFARARQDFFRGSGIGVGEMTEAQRLEEQRRQEEQGY